MTDNGDSDALSDLVAVCRAAPGSAALWRSLVRAGREAADPSPVLALLEEGPSGAADAELGDATRIAISQFLIDLERPDAGARWSDGSAPALKVQQARALIALGRLSEAVAAYRPAVSAEPNLKDPAIEARLTAAAAATRSATVIDLTGRPLNTEHSAPTYVPAVRERIMFADVGGLDDVKTQINRKIILPFQKPSLFQRFRKKSGGGVLMYGPPGCGKTMLARATAGECGAAFINVEIPEILDMYIGESEKRLAAVFSKARAQTPAVLFFDELEALAAKRRFGETSTGAALVSTFLAEMDGYQNANDGVLILAATNVPWAVDSAFRRHGRFDRYIFVPPPDAEARREILVRLMRDRPQSSSLDLAALAARASGFSGADLASLVEEACDLAIEESIDGEIVPISPSHFDAALKSTKPTTVDWLTSARNYAKYANHSGLYDDVTAFLDKNSRN